MPIRVQNDLPVKEILEHEEILILLLVCHQSFL